MEITPKTIQLCADLVTTRVAEYISKLYYESAEYVQDMLEAEERGDWAYWVTE